MCTVCKTTEDAKNLEIVGNYVGGGPETEVWPYGHGLLVGQLYSTSLVCLPKATLD